MVVKWNFTNVSTSASQAFEINPNDGGAPELSKNMTEQQTVAVTGITVIFEGARSTPKISFSGVILTESQYVMFTEWFAVNSTVQLDDDLGRSYIIYITKFSPKRVQSHNAPWKHTYTVEATILEVL